MSTADQVNTFLLAFEKLRLWSDGDPSSLCEDVLRDDSVGELCVQLLTLHGNLVGGLPTARPGLREGLVSQHVARLREYADRWERNVDLAAFAWMQKQNQELRDEGDLDEDAIDMLDRLDGISQGFSEMSRGLRDDIWSYLDTLGKEIQRDIDEELGSSGAIDEDGNCLTAVGRFFRTAEHQGWDLDGIVRRAGLLPEILVPSHVTKRLSNQAKPWIFEHLVQASNAYVIGSFAAALGLLRALMEHVLAEHYGATGKDLHDMVRNARGLPRTVREADLHGLRMAANAVLHPTDNHAGQQVVDQRRMETETAGHLRTVRDLVEGAPR